MTAALSGIFLGLLIGAACRWFDLPLPAPPRLVGALLVVCMTLGFLATDMVLESDGDGIDTEVTNRPPAGRVIEAARRANGRRRPGAIPCRRSSVGCAPGPATCGNARAGRKEARRARTSRECLAG